MTLVPAIEKKVLSGSAKRFTEALLQEEVPMLGAMRRARLRKSLRDPKDKSHGVLRNEPGLSPSAAQL